MVAWGSVFDKRLETNDCRREDGLIATRKQATRASLIISPDLVVLPRVNGHAIACRVREEVIPLEPVDRQILESLNGAGGMSGVDEVVRRNILRRVDALWRISFFGRGFLKSLWLMMASSGGKWSVPTRIKKRFESRIDHLVDKRVIVNSHALVESMFDGHESREQPPKHITVLGVPTVGRAAMVQRMLASASDAISVTALRRGLSVVVDDENGPGKSGEVRATVRSWQALHGGPAIYLGIKERMALCTKLAQRTDLPLKLLSFACLPNRQAFSDGAARNCLALLSVEQAVLSTDDDTLFKFTRFTPETGRDHEIKRFAVGAPSEPCSTEFLAEHQYANLKSSSNLMDPFALHEKYLGRSLRSVLAGGTEAAREIELVRITNETVEASSGPSKVILTSTGCFGDAGMSSSFGMFLEASPRTMAGLTSVGDAYLGAKVNRVIKRAVSIPTLSRGAYFQSMSFAFDNSILHPPFFPIWRNSDGVYMTCLMKTQSKGWATHLPEAVTHEPGEHRARFPISHEEAAANWKASEVVSAALQELALSGDSMSEAQRLTRVGQHLVELGAMSASSFSAFILKLYINRQRAIIAKITECICSGICTNIKWLEDFLRLRDRLERLPEGTADLVPSELISLGSKGWMTVMQDYLLDYGELCMAWPAVRDAARSLDVAEFIA
jgi:hypothetical protein